MIDPSQLGSDIAATSVALLTAPLLWLFLFVWAWDRPALAESVGFGRRTFWLLLPGAVLASIANAPFFGWDGSILAVNLGGGLIPIVLSILLLRHWERGEPRSLLPGYVLAFGALCAVLFALVLLPIRPALGLGGSFASVLNGPAVPGGADVWVVISVAAAIPLASAILMWLTSDPTRRLRRRRQSGLLLLSTAALLSTFFTSQAVPEVGILSQFPSYLYGPIAIGVLSPLLARPVFRLPAGAGLAIGYASATFGVLMGADLLHEPPLYGGAPGLLSIGGAGVADLVYLSGLISTALAFLVLLAIARKDASAWGSVPAPPPTSPAALWRHATRLHAEQRFPEAIATAEAAVAKAEEDHQQVWELPAPPTDRAAWGVPSPLYVQVDRQNLSSLAHERRNDPRDSSRALYAARGLIDHAKRQSQLRFATFRRRLAAFLIDLTVLTVPAAATWVLLAELYVRNLANSVELTAAIFAYLGYAFLYFAIYESVRGTTVGKRAMRLEVRDRRHHTPGPVPALLRSTTKTPILFLLALLISGSTFLLVEGSASSLPALGLVFSILVIYLLLAVTVLPLLLIALVTYASMSLNAERQRVGDLMAGTWVLDQRWSPQPSPPGRAVPGSLGPSAG